VADLGLSVYLMLPLMASVHLARCCLGSARTMRLQKGHRLRFNGISPLLLKGCFVHPMKTEQNDEETFGSF